MKFQIKVKDVGTSDETAHWEPYDKPEIKNLEQAKEWGECIVDWYNNTLRAGESSREFLGVREDSPAMHLWTKINGLTHFSRNQCSRALRFASLR